MCVKFINLDVIECLIVELIMYEYIDPSFIDLQIVKCHTVGTKLLNLTKTKLDKEVCV